MGYRLTWLYVYVEAVVCQYDNIDCYVEKGSHFYLFYTLIRQS